jgi:hypothetical protein
MIVYKTPRSILVMVEKEHLLLEQKLYILRRLNFYFRHDRYVIITLKKIVIIKITLAKITCGS